MSKSIYLQVKSRFNVIIEEEVFTPNLHFM